MTKEQDISFVAAPRQYVLHNSCPEVIELQFQAYTIWVPPVNTVDPKISAKDADGEFIPGTHVVSDIYMATSNGGETFMWSAANAVKHWLGLDSGKATGPYAKRGLSLLPINPSKESVEAVKNAGRDRARIALLETARQEILSYDQMNFARKAAGASPVPPGIAYDRAVALLSAYADEAKIKSAKALGVEIPKADVQEDAGMAMLDSAVNSLVEEQESKPKKGRPAKV